MLYWSGLAKVSADRCYVLTAILSRQSNAADDCAARLLCAVCVSQQCCPSNARGAAHEYAAYFGNATARDDYIDANPHAAPDAYLSADGYRDIYTDTIEYAHADPDTGDHGHV